MRNISIMTCGELSELDGEVLTTEELSELEEHDCVVYMEYLGQSGFKTSGHYSWYDVQLRFETGETENIDVYTKMVF